MTEITLEHNEDNVLTFEFSGVDEHHFCYRWFDDAFEKCGRTSSSYDKELDITTLRVDDFNTVREDWEAKAEYFAEEFNTFTIAKFVPCIHAIHNAKALSINGQGEIEATMRLGWVAAS